MKGVKNVRFDTGTGRRAVFGGKEMNKPDISPEAVEKAIGMCRLHGLHGTEATLRALSEALQAAEAENARLREALNDTAEHLYVAAAEGLASRYDARLDAFRRARALLTEKDDGWEEALQIASNAADEAYHS